MGQEIQEQRFERSDFRRFAEALKAETETLREWLRTNRFEPGPPRVGAEVEAWLVDDRGEPVAANSEIIAAVNDARVVHELARFNLEFNASPKVLQGRPFSAFEDELAGLLGVIERAAGTRQAGVVLVGILPTVREHHLGLASISPLHRYYALNEQVLLLRGRRPLTLDIEGAEPLHTEHGDVMLEAAATSLQVHLQVDPARAARLFNAAVAASAATVAVAANAPALFGRMLWEETRIPLFEQAVQLGPLHHGHAGALARVGFGSGYARDALYSFFVENRQHYPVLLPIQGDPARGDLPHLQFHNGTIWRWNRPLIGVGPRGRPNLRIEHRVMSAGPTPVDMSANAAFFTGLVHGLLDAEEPIEARLPFAVAEANFYTAARCGLAATVRWPGGERRLAELIRADLIPRADAGLARLGVSEGERQRYLDIIDHRVASGHTGSAWQRAWLERHGRDWNGLVNAYRRRQRSGEPVHRWTL